MSEEQANPPSETPHEPPEVVHQYRDLPPDESQKPLPWKFTYIHLFFLFIWIGLFLLLQDSIYVKGDDPDKIFWHRPVPVPNVGSWIGNRVVDDYVQGFLFQTFELIYEFFLPIGKSGNFLSMFQTFNSIMFASVYIGWLYLFVRTTKELYSDDNHDIWAAFVFSAGVLGSLIMYINMSIMFAYQVTALITVYFLLSAFPLGALKILPGTETNDEAVDREKNSVFLLLCAYLVAVSLESFMIFSWQYIGCYYLALLTKLFILGDRNLLFQKLWTKIKCDQRILLPFFLFSSWALYSVSTSGRTQRGLSAAPESLADLPLLKYKVFEFAFHKSTYFKIPILFSLILLVFFVLFAKNVLDAMREGGIRSVRDRFLNISPFVMFLMTLIFVYTVSLLLLSELTNINYVNDNKMRLPLDFLTLTFVFILGLDIVKKAKIPVFNAVLIIWMFVGLLAVFGDNITLSSASHIEAEKQRNAFDLASKATGNVVKIPFEPPKSGYGDSVLPGPHAPDWYRKKYRLMLNRYYGTTFDHTGPVFVIELSQP